MQRTAAPFSIGQVMSPAEAQAVITSFVPVAKRQQFARDPVRLLGALSTHAPQLVEHVVNKLRGWAFDSGEAGFWHKRGETT